MTGQRVPLLAGNWKMHGSRAHLGELAAIDRDVAPLATRGAAEFVFFLPAPLVAMTSGLQAIAIGGQDCHAEREGAFTGSVSAALLDDAGARWVLLGHSESRRDQRLDDAAVAARVRTAAAWLNVMLCVGEGERGRPPAEIAAQLRASLPDAIDPARLTIAYEPIWAIGTGAVPAPDQIAAVHAALRAELAARFGPAGDAVRILYGGSVSGANAASILRIDGVDGVLVGGASLCAASFLPIVAGLHDAPARAATTPAPAGAAC